MTSDIVSATLPGNTVRPILSAAESADGVAAFSEAFERGLDDDSLNHTHLIVEKSGAPVAVAGIAPDGSVEMVVHPEHRRAGHGRALVEAAREHNADAGFWAHGDLPAAQELAAAFGMKKVRELLVMGTVLDDDTQAPQLRDGYDLVAYPLLVDRWGRGVVDKRDALIPEIKYPENLPVSARRDDIALGDSDAIDASGDRRRHPRIGQVQPRGADGRSGRLDRGLTLSLSGLGDLERTGRNGAVGRQLLGAREIGVRLRSLRFRLPKLRLGGVQRDLERARIDLEQRLSPLDDPAFRDAHALDRATDLRPQFDGLGRRQIPGELGRRRDLSGDHLGDRHGGRAGRRCGRRRARLLKHKDKTAGDQQAPDGDDRCLLVDSHSL